MSTLHQLFDENELSQFEESLKEWPNIEYGPEHARCSVSPFTSFYFLYDPNKYVETSLLMIDIHEDFERLLGNPYLIATHPESERPHPYGSKRLPNLRQFAQNTPIDKSFTFNFTDENTHTTSPATAGYFWRNATWNGKDNIAYSSIQFYYRWQWWQDNREAWREFVLRTIDRLNPQQVYSGFAMANPLAFGSRSEVATWERALTTRFYGLDIDYPFGMSDELMDGIRPATWAFFLSNDWRERLEVDKETVAVTLSHPQINVTDLQCGHWIELGIQPELYPVENGVPEMPGLLNRFLKPIRHNQLGLIGFGQWEGDPNERFTSHDAKRWMSRFDDDSDWPTASARFPAPIASQFEPTPNTVLGGSLCPRSGWWYTSAHLNSHRQFEEGEIFPNITSDTTQGFTVWHWAEDQGSPTDKR